MARKTNPKNTEGLIQDFELEFNEEWAVEFLSRMVTTRQNFVDSYKLNKYRKIDLGEFDAEDLLSLKSFFDPKDKATGEGGTAEYMRTDWKQCPSIQSLINIVKKQIKEGIDELTVNGSDKISVDKKAKEKLRILNKRNIVDNINEVLALTNDVPVSYDVNLDKLFIPDSVDDSVNLIDKIKAEAQDDWDYSILAESGMLKDGVEIAHEQMISHNVSNSKFTDTISDDLIGDYMKICALCYMFYTSKTTGLPEVTYIEPDKIFVSPFFSKDSSDKDYWGYEFTSTWSEYMKMAGGAMTIEQNKKVYEANRAAWYSTASYPDYDANLQNPSYAFLNTIIRLGYVEVKQHTHNQKTGKYYDVIKKFYYLPLQNSSLNVDAIIGLGDLQDMHRMGNNLQNADFSIIMRRDNTKMSFYDIMKVEFDRMNKIYNQYLNTFASFIPEGVVFAEEPLRALADELISELEESGAEMDANSSANIQAKIVRRVKQSGSMIAKRRKGDNDEERLDSPTMVMENKILIDCTGLLQQLMSCYNMMLMSLGINPNRLAQEPKPRTTNRSIQGATSNSSFATMDLEEAYKFCMMEFGQRMLYYDQQVISEFDKNGEPSTDRAKEMKALLGTKGVNWLEVYKDMPYQRCILQVETKPSEEEKMILLNYVTQLEMQGKIPVGTLVALDGIDNFKLQKLFVQASIKRQQRIAIENQQALMEQQAIAQQQAAAQQAQQQAALMQQQTQAQAALDAQNNQMKTQGQLVIKDKTLENRKEEDTHKAALEAQKKQQEALI